MQEEDMPFEFRTYECLSEYMPVETSVIQRNLEEDWDKSCEIYNAMRKDLKLCDAVLKVDHVEFPVHRVIMAACSPYFKYLFTCHSNAHFDCESRVEYYVCDTISAEVLQIVIDYAYTKKADIIPENIELLLSVADQFHILGLLQSCVKYLRQNLSVENCIGIWMLAKHHTCPILENTAFRFLLRHFTNAAFYSQEFLQLSLEDLVDLLSSENLNVANEENTFEAAIRWISKDPGNRRKFIPLLLRCVRLGLLSQDYFRTKVEINQYVRSEPQCSEILDQALKLLVALDTKMYANIDFTHPLTRPRVPAEVMFVIGGWNTSSPTNLIETYDARADRWVPMQSKYHDTGPTAYHGCVSLGGKVYIIGGFDGEEYYSQVRCFNPATKKWSESAPMHQKRCYVNVAVHGGMIYAMGGFNGQIRQKTAERYSPRTNQWTEIARMNNARSDAGACASQDFVFCVGGFDGLQCLSTGEYYDPRIDQWTYIKPMSSARSGVGIVMYRDHIYAVGGFNGSHRLNTAEKYDQVRDVWRHVPDLHIQRSNFAIEVIDDMIYVIGGYDGRTTIKDVECYDENAEEWYEACDMTLNRSALSAAVVQDLPNVNDFIIRRTK